MKNKFIVSFKKRISDTGEKKFIYLQVGRAFENEDGHIDVIINSTPLNWDGKLRLWKVDPNKDSEGES